MRSGLPALFAAATALTMNAALALDQNDSAYGQVLAAHVHWTQNGHASVVDYRALRRDRATLDAALASWSAVTPQQFDGWSRPQQMVFLINAYNGFTLKLIIDHEPGLKSIRDLGSLFRSPWKQPFFHLLGAQRTLDWIEHEKIRPVYHEPRVHFALNCASISCPALRPEPYRVAQLEQQLDDQVQRFVGDRSRNRYNAANQTLYVSQIFRWYGDDFAADGNTLADWMGRHADLLADDANTRAALRAPGLKIDYLSYDWKLNGSGR